MVSIHWSIELLMGCIRVMIRGGERRVLVSVAFCDLARAYFVERAVSYGCKT